MSTDKTTPMMAQYLETKKQYADCLLFYRMGDFYELFFDDALAASKALDIVLTYRGKHQGHNIPMCGVPFHAYENYLLRLVKKGFKVAVCEQLETPQEAKKRGTSAVVKRDVIRIVTPGTLTEDTLLPANRNNFIGCLAPGAAGDAVAWMDISTGDFYTEHIPANLLSSTLARLNLSEIVLADNVIPVHHHLFDSLGITITPKPAESFSYVNTIDTLKTFFGLADLAGLGDFSKSEIIAAGVLLAYVLDTQKGAAPYLKSLKKIAADGFMEIDASTRRSLELTQTLSDDKRSQSVLAAIDYTSTGAGARLLADYLSSPLLDIGQINARLDKIDYFVIHPDVQEATENLLKGMPDLERALGRLSLGRGGPRDLRAIGTGLNLIPALRNILQTPIVPESLEKNKSDLGSHTALVDEIERAIMPEPPLLTRDGGFIQPGYNAVLDELLLVKNNARKILADLQAKYIGLTNINTLKVTFNNLLGYFIEVPASKAAPLLENKELGFIHRQTLLNNVRFTTVELGELETKITQADTKILGLEQELFLQLAARVLAQKNAIILAAAALAQIDVAAGLARAAILHNYTRPVLTNGLDFSIRGGRHLIVEQSLKKEQKSFIPNDCVLEDDAYVKEKNARSISKSSFNTEMEGGSDAQDRKRTLEVRADPSTVPTVQFGVKNEFSNGTLWILTGPNMAGKSTFLRQNALIAVLAQMGSFVPAEHATIGIVDKLYSRVGASDDLARGRSTFMVEMVEVGNILNGATPRSLVILDEVGRGTATFDGLSLAWAVVEYLAAHNKSRGLFATHYHELTALADKIPTLSLHTMRIKEWQGDIVFLHEVVPGSADKSYGVHVAKLAGLPTEVLHRATQILGELETKSAHHKNTFDNLPLFDAATANVRPPHESAVEKELNLLNTDMLSPKEALDLLYRLKTLL